MYHPGAPQRLTRTDCFLYSGQCNLRKSYLNSTDVATHAADPNVREGLPGLFENSRINFLRKNHLLGNRKFSDFLKRGEIVHQVKH
jgi:hypothetical protein